MKNKNITIGFVLIALGILWLLSNLGIIAFSIWAVLFDLWPVILIILGLNIIFKNNKNIVIIAWILFIIFAIFYGLNSNYLTVHELENLDIISNNLTIHKLENSNVILEKNDSLNYGKLNLNLKVGNIEIKSSENELLSAYTTDPKVYYKTNINNSSKTAIIDFRDEKISIFKNKGYRYKFNIDNDLTWDFNIKLGAMDSTFDLRDIDFKNLNIDTGAADISIFLGKKLKNSKIDIDIGAGSIDITIPKELGVKIKFNGGVKHGNLNKLNWIHSDDYYISPNYDNANKKVYIAIDIGAGNLNIIYN